MSVRLNSDLLLSVLVVLRGRRLFAVAGGFGRALGSALGERALDFGQQQLPHLLARRLVEPVEEPAASGRLAQTLIDLEAQPGEVLFDLGHALQPFALPAAEAQGTGGLDRPVLHALKRWRSRRRTLKQPRVVALQGRPQRFQTGR